MDDCHFDYKQLNQKKKTLIEILDPIMRKMDAPSQIHSTSNANNIQVCAWLMLVMLKKKCQNSDGLCSL
jgi:hypothetical protein